MNVHHKTPELSRLVKALATYGVPYKDIAVQAGIADKTLERRYKEELDAGTALAHSKLLQTAYHMAVEERNTTMLIFLMKTRLRMKDGGGDREAEAEPQKVVVKPVVEDGRAKTATD